MILKLRSPQSQFPAGGFPFKDPLTNYEVKGVAAYEQTAQGLATKIIKIRQANPHLTPSDNPAWLDHASVVQEVFRAKFATNPELFIQFDGTVPVAPKGQTVAAPGVKCKFCQSDKVTAVKCATCGGSKIKGYHCDSCNKDWKP